MNKNITYFFRPENTSSFKTVKIFLFCLVIPYHMFFYSMDFSDNQLFELTINSEEKKSHEIIYIPQSIDNTIEQLKQKINNDCQYYSNQIDEIRKEAFKYFQNNSGLTEENWTRFTQEIEKIPAHTKFFTPPPCFFQQSIITPNISITALKSLEKNCIQNKVCFQKMNVRQSTEIHEFALHTPFYASLLNPTEFNFLPDELKLNSTQYNHNSHFFNICIIAALKEDIARIQYFFETAYRYQLGELEYDPTEYIPYFECNQLHEQTHAPLIYFILNRLRTGILHLILRKNGAAKIINNCLITNPELCNKYGITKEDHEFLEAMIHIDSLKCYIQVQKQTKINTFEEISRDSVSCQSPEYLMEEYNNPYNDNDILYSFL